MSNEEQKHGTKKQFYINGKIDEKNTFLIGGSWLLYFIRNWLFYVSRPKKCWESLVHIIIITLYTNRCVRTTTAYDVGLDECFECTSKVADDKKEVSFAWSLAVVRYFTSSRPALVSRYWWTHVPEKNPLPSIWISWRVDGSANSPTCCRAGVFPWKWNRFFIKNNLSTRRYSF